MANPDHLAKLEEGVEAWNRWRKEDDFVQPDLGEANLIRADLERAHLEGANLIRANLSWARLEGANLTRANLTGANLAGANLRGAYLIRGADLTGANLTQADLTQADLTGAYLTGANLVEANLVEANLERANLTRARLRGAHLRGATLREANLERANLERANLEGANLTRARLEEANFERANLSRAHLEGANLTRARLQEANLEGANLERANLTRASCEGTFWVHMNLIEAIGLPALEHHGGSTVGTDTLALSKGRIPVEFLRGCGLADWEIENAKLYDPDLTTAEITDIQYRIYDLLARGPIQISPVFISYSHCDAAFVDKLGTSLDKKGVRYWRDIKDAEAGPLGKVIERGISLNPTLLLVLSKHAIESDWVEYEVDKAVQLSKRLNRHVLCPIALDNAWLENSRMSENLQTQIKKYNVLDFGAHDNENAFGSQFRRLLDGLGLHYRDQTGSTKFDPAVPRR